MYSSRLNSILSRIDCNLGKAVIIMNKITNICKTEEATGEGKEYLEKLKGKVVIEINKLSYIKSTLVKNVYSDDEHLFYYEKEVNDIAGHIKVLDVE